MALKLGAQLSRSFWRRLRTCRFSRLHHELGSRYGVHIHQSLVTIATEKVIDFPPRQCYTILTDGTRENVEGEGGEERVCVPFWSTPAASTCLCQRKCAAPRTHPSLSTRTPNHLHPPLFLQHRLVLCGSFACLHTSPWQHSPDKKAKAVVEKAVDNLKEKKDSTAEAVDNLKAAGVDKKAPLSTRLWDVVLHYYHGFRLLALDIRVAIRLLFKTIRGSTLTRRENKLFRRTVADMFRIVPFSVFIIIPFMEFLLPVYLYLFPNALPSTFQSSSSKADRKKKELKVKLQMAKFLQDTVEEMAVTGKKNKRDAVKEFAQFFEKIRGSGQQASTESIIKFSKLFEDELTLDNLSTPTLKALCRLLLLQPIGSSNFLRFQLRMKLRQLMADDQMIQKEGVDSLTVLELQAASQARGMRALGMPEERLRSQLSQWLDLHLNQQVPTSLLLLSRALYLPVDVPTSDALQATLSTLPQPIVEEAGVRVADSSGEAVDNKTRLEVIRQQEELIKEEAIEKEKEREEMEAAAVAEAARLSTETTEDTAPIISTSPPSTTPSQPEEVLESISAEEIRNLNEAMATLKGERSLEDEIQELKEEREEYRDDVAELAEECAKVQEELSESKGSARLGKKVDTMIQRLDETLGGLERDYVDEGKDGVLQRMQKDKRDIVTCAELEAALHVLKETSGEAKVRSLISVLDEDHDGNINVQEVAAVIESLAREDTDIKPEHIALIKQLIQREEQEEEEDRKQNAASS